VNGTEHHNARVSVERTSEQEMHVIVEVSRYEPVQKTHVRKCQCAMGGWRI
jgi:hypothetical protein